MASPAASRALRVGLVLVGFLAGLFAAGVAAATIRAGTPASTATITTTTATSDTTTTSVTTIAPTTTDATTATTTAESTTTPTSTLTPVSRPIGGGCLLVGGLALLGPGRPPLVLGPVVQAPGVQSVGLGAFSYPADGSIVAAVAVNLRTSGCGRTRLAAGVATVESLSLFGGAVTARSVEFSVRADKPGPGSGISGLTIGGNPVAVRPGVRMPIASWGYAVALARPAPLPGEPGSLEASALAVHVLEPHAGLAAGTVLLVSFAGLPLAGAASTRVGTTKRSTSPPAARERRRARANDQQFGRPLKVTPPLGLPSYIFPVVGQSDYIDTYGGFRSDVAGDWHHGDDIFAALGTPVVAVASGTVNRVGWEPIGGWRLWVRDGLGNEFYYAHLSGYGPAVLHSNRVRAGEVVGFIGNTGDAFTTSPHVHFEIHPHTLLRLEYNGAVDPTTYLDQWTHLHQVPVPRPAHPPLPTGAVRQEAIYVFRELLAARHLITHAPKPSQRPQIHLPGNNSPPVAPGLPARESAPTPTRTSRHRQALSAATVALLAGLGSLALFALIILGRRYAAHSRIKHRNGRPDHRTPNQGGQALPSDRGHTARAIPLKPGTDSQHPAAPPARPPAGGELLGSLALPESDGVSDHFPLSQAPANGAGGVRERRRDATRSSERTLAVSATRASVTALTLAATAFAITFVIERLTRTRPKPRR